MLGRWHEHRSGSIPTPNPIRKSPVANDSVTSLTPNSAVACGKAAESILEAKPTIHPMNAMLILYRVSPIQELESLFHPYVAPILVVLLQL